MTRVTQYAYIGIKEGLVRAIVADDPGYEDETAEMVAGWIKEGRTVERVTWENGMARMKSECALKTAQGETPNG